MTRLLQARGITVIDLDLIARQIVQPGRKAYNQIVKEFGKEILQEDGQLDRPKLGAIIFRDAEARKKLNAITHPQIFVELFKQLAWHLLKGTSLVVIGE